MILNAKNLSKSYRNGAKELSVFNNLSLEVERGDLITIMGPSGAGKSTLLNILGTLDRSDSGTLILDNQNIDTLNNNQLAHLRNSLLGFVFQFHHLLPEFTAFENVMLPNQIAGKKDNIQKAEELLNYIGLIDRKDHYPFQLSGGERLRVAVVRALMNETKLVLADEPTGNLDLENANRLIGLFQKINTDFKQTLVITTHNSEVASIGNKRYYLEKGTLSELDSI
jgi:ABC-type lipoprotein export system ATPase subunit